MSTGRISKIGDGGVRTALYEAAHIILTRPVKGSRLKSWALRLAKRAGMKKAKVALARKLAVVLHRMLGRRHSFIHHAEEPPPGSLTEERSTVFGQVTTPAFPKRSPVAGTMDQVRPLPTQSVQETTRS